MTYCCSPYPVTEDTDEDSPESKPNLYKKDLSRHAAAVQSFVDLTLTSSSGYGNPCTDICKKVDEGGWISPAATTWTTTLSSIGTSIKTAFSNHKSDVDQDISLEPAEVSVPGQDAWKAKWESVAAISPDGDLAEGWRP